MDNPLGVPPVGYEIGDVLRKLLQMLAVVLRFNPEPPTYGCAPRRYSVRLIPVRGGGQAPEASFLPQRFELHDVAAQEQQAPGLGPLRAASRWRGVFVMSSWPDRYHGSRRKGGPLGHEEIEG